MPGGYIRRPSPTLQFSCDFYDLLCVAKLHTNLLKSLAKILGIFVASYNCLLSSVWEAGPFISAPLHLSFNLVVHTVIHPEHLVATHELAVLRL